MIASGYIPHITKPTHITDHNKHRSATIIDHIFSNNVKDESKSGIIITDISDHFATYHLVEKGTKQLNEERQFRQINETNTTQFKKDLAGNDFTKILEINDPNEAYNKYISQYMDIFNKNFPIKTIKMTRKYAKKEPWVTKGITISSVRKSKLYKLKMKKRDEPNKQKYLEYCKIYKKVVRNAKVNYYTTKLHEYKYNMKETWKLLNKALLRTKQGDKLPNAFEINNNMTSNTKEIVEGFNNFFTNIAGQICDNIPTSQRDYTTYLKNSCPKSFYLHPITEEDLINTTRKLKPKTSSGQDNISTKLLKETITEIATPLTHIFNTTFTTGIIPDSQKIAKILPIHKAGNKIKLNNYRPISLLPSHSKLLEKMVCTQLLSFLEKNNVLYEHQYGFRRNRSTIQPIIKLLRDIAEENDMKTKNITTAVFLDLSKAFDTLSHDKLLKKLHHCGIRGLSNDWFRNYLQNRKQYVSLEGTNSNLSAIQLGVPQGSILGPILFLIYINDIQHATTLNLLSYADDTTVYTSGATLRSIIPKLNEELGNLNQWFMANKLSLNINKTNYMIFTPGHLQHDGNTQIMINGHELTQAGKNRQLTSVKFLGLYIDENLTWRHHIDKIQTKLNSSIYAINSMKNFLPHYALRTLYQTLVESHLTYGIQLWGNSSHCDKLFKTQKRALRYIYKKPRISHTDPLFKKSKIMKLPDIYHVHTALFMRDIKNKRLPYVTYLKKTITTPDNIITSM